MNAVSMFVKIDKSVGVQIDLDRQEVKKIKKEKLLKTKSRKY
jgi:hypothetical protein